MSKKEKPKKRGPGRPPKGAGPSFPVDEVDRLLVHGKADEKGDATYPSFRELAKQYGVSHSIISDYSKRHSCIERRHAARASVRRQTDELLVTQRAKALALKEEEVVLMVDCALRDAMNLIEEKRLRCGAMTDVNMLVRLHELLRGNADTRQEVIEGLSLEDLRDRHRRALDALRNASLAVRGRDEQLRPEARAKPEGAGQEQKVEGNDDGNG